MNGINCSGLQGTEKFSGWHDLVCKIKLDLKFTIGGLVNGIHNGFRHMFAKSRTGIGLHAPFDGTLRSDNIGCSKRRGTRSAKPHQSCLC
ncbi:hypothetical protein D3C80_1658470 [compost metagenome]